MRIANLAGRLVLVVDRGAAVHTVDVEQLSEGRFSADPQAVYERWDEFVGWARDVTMPLGATFDPTCLGPPVPAPRQIFAIGLNYREHADEAGFGSPAAHPPVFTKYVSCLAGPYQDVVLPEGGHTDWEVELVAVIGRRARHVTVEDAPSYIAGFTVGQDLSERVLQMAAAPPQFSLGKSLPGFGPTGPWVVTLDEFADPDDLELGCAIDGEQVQLARTRELIFSVPSLVAMLSTALPLVPGDLIFTGTPSGVGLGRTPPRWLQRGEVLSTHIEGIGELRNLML